MKFKKGDIIIGNEKADARYRVTHEGWKGEVVEIISDKCFRAKALGTKERPFLLVEDYFDLYSPQKIVITTDGRETLARLYDGNSVVKSATAKCSPDDEFNFETGAKIAIERLFKKEFVPHLVSDDNAFNLGVIGKKTNYKDAIGRELCIGDTVDLYRKDDAVHFGEYSVVEADDFGQYIMSIHRSCDEKTGTIKNWNIIKKRSYKEVKNGEIVGDYVKYVKEQKDV